MCGICGILGKSDPQEMRKRVEAMCAAMRHRGPDDEGFHLGEGVALGMRRLSIIDLDTGHQPIYNEDGSVVIVFNGEIYNFQTLRTDLERRGHRFITRTDAEVIVHLYEEYGPDCIHHLRGMFAFAIYDQRSNVQRSTPVLSGVEGFNVPTLFLARDRLGIKPLYWAETANGFVFASELKAMLASGLVEREVDLEALDCYLAYGSVAPPRTMLAGVQALPAGHRLLLDGRGPHIEVYWDVSFPNPDSSTLSRPDAVARLRALLEESVRLHLVSDVPLGAFLSGGIDSSAVVGLMACLGHRPIRTFSIGFQHEGRKLDERSYAQIVARRFGTEHFERIVTGEDVREELDRIIWGLDQPSVDGVNSYLVAQTARQHVTVALSGLGGDELFAGYPQFRHIPVLMERARIWRRLPGLVKEVATLATDHLPAGVVQRTLLRDVEILRRNPRQFLDFYRPFRTLWSLPARWRMLAPDVRASMNRSVADQVLASQLGPDTMSPLHQVGRLELKTYMAATLLRDMDAMSMAHSLEARVPLLDHRLLEFVCSLPAAWKLDSSRPKPLLTEALADILPREIVHRRKMGFELPMGQWLRGPLRAEVSASLSADAVRKVGLLDPAQVPTVWAAFLAGASHSYTQVWALFVLQRWMQEVADGR